MMDEPMPAGSDPQAALLRRLGRPIAGQRPALFPPVLLGHVEELRRFRHVARHADDAPRKATIPVEAAAAVVEQIDQPLGAFRTALDP